MSDTDTAIRAAKIRRIRGKNFVVLKVGEMFTNREATILEIAEQLRLQPDTVLSFLLDNPANAHVRKALFQEQVATDDEGEPPSDVEQRRQLRRASITHKDSKSGRNKVPDQFHYKQWKVNPSFDEPILLPLSQKFVQVLIEAEGNAALRERLVKIAAPLFDTLRDDLKRLDDATDKLSDSLNELEGKIKPALQEFHFIDVMKKTLALMGVSPDKDNMPSDDDRADAVKLRVLVDDFAKTAYRDMVADAERPLRDRIARQARTVRSELRLLVIPLKFYKDRTELAPEDLHELIPKSLIDAYSVLFLTTEAEDIIKNEVVPLLNMLSTVTIPVVSVTALDPDTQAGFGNVGGPTGVESALSVMGSMIGTTTVAVGNLPGPASLCGAVLSLAQAQAHKVLTADPGQLRNLSGRMLRAVFVLGGLPKDECIRVVDAIDAKDLVALKQIDLSERFQTGPRMATALSILFAITLIQALTSDEEKTFSDWAGIIGGGFNVALGVSQALGHCSRLSSNPVIKGMTGTGTLAAGLGTVAAFAGIVTGVATVSKEYKTNDVGGVIVASASLVGSALSVAGFLIAQGFIAEGTIVGVPAGVALQAAGTAIAVGAGVVALIRELSTSGPSVVFEGLVEHVGRDGGVLDVTAILKPGLRDAFEKVRTAHHDVDLWVIGEREIQMLADFGYEDNHIALLVNRDRLFVKARVQRP